MSQEHSVSAIAIGAHDSNNREIVDVYARETGRYAIYQTAQRVIIAYADDPLVQQIQRRRLARLAVLRAEIDAMLAGWRTKSASVSRLPETARQYDQQVASALIVAMEGDAETGLAILNSIKATIAGEMASRARLAYVLWTLVSAGIVILASLAIAAIVRISEVQQGDHERLLVGVVAGVLGAIYSIALRIEKRDLRNDMRRFDNFTDSFVRIGIGALGALVLGCFLASGAIAINFSSIGQAGNAVGNTTAAAIAPQATAGASHYIFVVLIAGFLAGFVERFVPDLLSSYSVTARPADVPPPPPTVLPAAPAKGTADPDKPDAGALPDDENAVVTPPSPEEDVDGCNVDFADPATITADENLPPASGGVAQS